MHIGTYNFALRLRGDTFRERAIASVIKDGEPLMLTRACLQVRTQSDGELVHEWTTEGETPTASITENVVILHRVEAEATKLWKPGAHVYDLEIETTEGDVRTIITGIFQVETDTTKCQLP